MINLSIITATYNRPGLLKRMINSVRAQTHTDWELIIVDDSTNLETSDLMSDYINDEKIKYLKNQKNMGLPYSRNRGLETASGRWLTFLDDDDYYATSHTLEEIMKLIQAASCPWHAFKKVLPNGRSVTQAIIAKNTYNWTTDFLYGNAIRGDVIPFFKKEFIGNTRYTGNHRAEWQFWYELSKKSDFIHHPIDVVVAEYLPDGMSNLGYLRKERVYQGQQFSEMIRNRETWKYLPIISRRYLTSFIIIRKIINALRGKKTSH